MVTVTVLVAASRDGDGCPYLDAWVECARALCEPIEFLIADARIDSSKAVRPDMRRIAMPGGSMQGLIDEGMRQARGDWVLLTEDHCRPLPGVFEAYWRAMRDQPDIDLFAGGVENLTSTGSWSFANFLAGLYHVWPHARRKPADASNANLLVRRSAIAREEIAIDGGFLARTIPRLIDEGRYAGCPDARVDHIVHVSGPLHGMSIEHRIVMAATISRRQVLSPRAPAIQVLRDLAAIPYYIVVSPWLITWHLRGTPQYVLGTVFRLAVLGIAIGVAPLKVDLKRWFRPAANVRSAA